MRIIAATLLSLALAASASAERIYVPAVGSVRGDFDSVWTTSFTFHNAGATAVNAKLRLIQGSSAIERDIVLAPKSTFTRSIGDIFGVDSASGALTIDVSDSDRRKIVVTTRIFNVSANGEFGQDVPSYDPAERTFSGRTAVITGPSSSAGSRLNFGVLATEASAIEWSVVRRDGTVAATKSVAYGSEQHVQYNRGIETLLDVAPHDNDVVYAKVVSGAAIVYGSVINNSTNDPAFVRAREASGNLPIRFLGVDLDENGSVDLADANDDGRLDATVELFTGSFPNYFRIVASDPENQTLTYALVDGPRDAQFIDTNGTLLWYPGAHLRGTTTTLKVRVSDGTDSTIVTIPVLFR